MGFSLSHAGSRWVSAGFLVGSRWARATTLNGERGGEESWQSLLQKSQMPFAAFQQNWLLWMTPERGSKSGPKIGFADKASPVKLLPFETALHQQCCIR